MVKVRICALAVCTNLVPFSNLSSYGLGDNSLRGELKEGVSQRKRKRRRLEGIEREGKVSLK